MPSVNGKVVFITGGARGIGCETARLLVKRGAKVVLVDVDAGPLAEVVAELGPSAVSAVADVRDLSSMQAAVRRGVEAFGRIDAVLANAGIGTYGSIRNIDPVMFQRIVDINLVGVFHTVRAALPALIESKGYVLLVASLAAFSPAPGLSPYAATKAGVEQLASGLRLEVDYLGVGVGSAHMSWVDTPMVRDAKDDLGAFAEMLTLLPWPLNKTTTVDKCAAAFVDGLANRKRRVYVPGWVRFLGWAKPIVTSRVGERSTIGHVPRLVPAMDEQAAALGRGTSARYDADES
ncbi:SDR family oxidoreductase [Williamsia sp. CHRR-6]|uniref:SDR family oxidoreductase n=1 Tax=Williamsia sp. CHRR-6 TaxID=2835871 RepID=UPI001BD9897A|nr:SDR family oxidoreductase [Williamsia sp. CHRR-6]MBT0567679.1 SDR family oxidoreductase [Williamsia sp. CHRR-6]